MTTLWPPVWRVGIAQVEEHLDSRRIEVRFADGLGRLAPLRDENGEPVDLAPSASGDHRRYGSPDEFFAHARRMHLIFAGLPVERPEPEEIELCLGTSLSTC